MSGRVEKGRKWPVWRVATYPDTCLPAYRPTYLLKYLPTYPPPIHNPRSQVPTHLPSCCAALRRARRQYPRPIHPLGAMEISCHKIFRLRSGPSTKPRTVLGTKEFCWKRVLGFKSQCLGPLPPSSVREGAVSRGAAAARTTSIYPGIYHEIYLTDCVSGLACHVLEIPPHGS